MNKDKEFEDTMSDDDIYVLGGGARFKTEQPKKKGKKKNHWEYGVWLLAVLLVASIVLCLYFFTHKSADNQVIQPESTESQVTVAGGKEQKRGGDATVLVRDTVINDIPLQVLVPHGGRLELCMGDKPKGKDVLLFAQAADCRGDKDIPAGAFVYRGEVIAKGHAKYGFCAIIGDEVTLGRELETPFFERAVEENGSFFRQYSIVSDGRLVRIPPKGKAIRRALCLHHNELQIITTQDRESFHDFSQALVDLGVQEAIALVGGDALLQYTTPSGDVVTCGQPAAASFKSVNYIVWRQK